MLKQKEDTLKIAATKAGMDEKTARKYIKIDKLPSDCKIAHTWQTRPDPFEEEWLQIKEMLETDSNLEAKTIFQYFQREKPSKFQDGQLRTLQRKIKNWRATEGPAKETYFPQKHYPGRLSESDFTHMSDLEITINNELFHHLLYHYVLTYSNWETGTICYSESFSNLSEGLQNALWKLGGVPKKHRTDRMSAAVHKDCNPEKFTDNYSALLRHYDITGERIQAGKANEDGDIEQRHYRFKKALDQRLRLRGSRNFDSLESYRKYLDKLFNDLNLGREERFKEELKVLHRLPLKRLESCVTKEVRVRKSSTIRVNHNTYSVHSRLIHEKVISKVYVDHIEIWYGQKRIDLFPRIHGSKKHSIQYRHIIDWLIRKPGAFENYIYKSDLFPSSYFRMAYDYLCSKHSKAKANKEYLKILHLAAQESETHVELGIKELLSSGKDINISTIEEMVKNKELSEISCDTKINISQVILSDYDKTFLSSWEES
jgi:hypothetical protein